GRGSKVFSLTAVPAAVRDGPRSGRFVADLRRRPAGDRMRAPEGGGRRAAMNPVRGGRARARGRGLGAQAAPVFGRRVEPRVTWSASGELMHTKDRIGT